MSAYLSLEEEEEEEETEQEEEDIQAYDGPPWYPDLAGLTADKYFQLWKQTHDDIEQLKSRLGRDKIGPKTVEEQRAWLKDRDFTTKKDFDAFIAAGGWNAFPNAVLIRVDMRCIKDIDLVGGKFTVNMAVCATFRTPDKKVPDKDSAPFRLSLMTATVDEYFMRWENLLENNFIRQEKKYDNEFATVVAFENDIEFFETFQLHNFPFDVHFCKITIGEGSGKGLLVPYIGLLNQSMPLAEWHVLAPNWSCCVEKKEGDKERCTCTIRFVLQRKSAWFVVNFLALMSVLCSLDFYVYVIPPDDAADRSSVTLTLMLTVTALKLVMADSLPKIAYLTMLDRYMIVATMLLASILITNVAVAAVGERLEFPALASTFPDLSGQRILDLMLAGVLLTAWIIYHVQLIWRILSRRRQIRDVFGPPLDVGPLGMPDRLKVLADDFVQWQL